MWDVVTAIIDRKHRCEEVQKMLSKIIESRWTITRKYSVSSGPFYLTFNKVDVALVCQTRNFETELLVCTLCFPNIVHVIFIRTVSFNFHLNHGHLLVWFLKEQEAHFVDNIRHYQWLKSWFLCQVDKLRDIILIFFYKLWKQTIDPGNAIFCANFLLGNTLCPAAYKLINISRDWGASQFVFG